MHNSSPYKPVFVRHDETGRKEIKVFGSVTVLQSGYILVKPILSGQFIRAWEVVHSLIRPQSRKGVRTRVRARPQQILISIIEQHGKLHGKGGSRK